MPGDGCGALLADPVSFALLRVATFPFCAQFAGGGKQFTGGVRGVVVVNASVA